MLWQHTKKLYPRSERFSNTASVTYQTVVMRRMFLSLHVGQWNALLDVTRLQKKTRFTTLSFKQLCHPLKQQLTLVVRPSPVSSESQSVHLDSFLLLQEHPSLHHFDKTILHRASGCTVLVLVSLCWPTQSCNLFFSKPFYSLSQPASNIQSSLNPQPLSQPADKVWFDRCPADNHIQPLAHSV